MPQNDPTKLLEKQSIGKLLLSYSLPAIAGMVVVSLYNIVDSIFIGHGVGAMGLTGLAVSFPLMNLQMAACLLVAVGGSALCSIELGRKNKEKAQNILGNMIVLALIMGLAFGIPCLLFLDPILMLFGASPESLPYSREFMQILLLASPLFFLMLSLNNVTRATGYPRKAMLTSIISVCVNIVLAPIFIFVFEWGMRGAALATLGGQSVALVWLFMHVKNQDSVLHLMPGIYKLRKNVVKPMLAIGMSPFLMNVCGCLVVIIMNLSLRKYGGDLAIGAFGIVNRLLMLFGMSIVGLTHGMQPIVGYNFGAGQPDRVKQTLRYGVIAASIVTTVGCLAAQLFPQVLARVFTDDAELIALSVNGLRVSTVMFFLVGSQIVISSYFQFIGLAAVATFLSISRQMLFLLPCLVFLPPRFGLDGVWASMPLADAVTTLVTFSLLLWSIKKGHLERGGAGFKTS